MKRNKIKAYRLYPAAQKDLEDIWLYTAQTWSVERAITYTNGIRETLEIIVDFPEIARLRMEIEPPVRIHTYQSHLIVYHIEHDHIAVIRIRHGREGWQDGVVDVDGVKS